MTTILAMLLAALLADPSPGGAAMAPVPAAAEQMTIARLQYDGGGDWYVGPSSLPNLLAEIRTRTGLPVADQPVTVRLTDPRLWRHPFLFLTGHGNVRFSEEEVAILRRYLLSGGFLLAEDCYGMDEFFRREIARVFPDKQMVPLPHDHPVFHLQYKFPNGPPKVHEHDGKPPQAFGIFHEGRMVMMYLYESDIHDGWEDADVHDNPPDLREASFRLGVNIFLYALAQVAR
jgi:hypothetical protein